MADIIGKMEVIQSIFIDSKEKSLSISNLNDLNDLLLATNPEFISLAYEAASMGIAIKSIENNNSLATWKKFYQDYGKSHAAQMHVGLGWAISELKLDVSAYLNELENHLKYRVIDGFAYYDGKFKRRQSVRNQQIPENLDILDIRAYNQGLGRSFWYNAQGEVEKLTKLISIFPPERYYDMWRGVGVAVAYVGGISTSELKELMLQSNENLNALKCGIAIAIQTREKANAIVNDTEIICEFVLQSNTKTISEKLTQLEKENTYFDWIKKIEEEL